MELAQQDQLRLHVLLKQKPFAIRINESNLCVYGLTPRGEATVQLHPTCSEHKYLRLVRELLSNFALGSPEGYPVFLRRWRRMEGKQSENIAALLLLGEPEAIIDAARAPSLTAELASYAWWAMPTSDIARTLLRNPNVIAHKLAPQLIAFLIEFLPFETEPNDVVESVQAILQTNLLDAERLNALWKRAERNPAIYVGFLRARPDDLPLSNQATSRFDALNNALSQPSNKTRGTLLVWLNSDCGQAFLSTLKRAIEKLPNQETTVILFQAVHDYFARYSTDALSVSEFENMFTEHRAMVDAMNVLLLISDNQLDAIFSQTDAVGTVMRKKLTPVTQPILDAIAVLME